MITGLDILTVINDRLRVEITPDFTYSDLTPVEKDLLNRYVLSHTSYDHACEIIPGIAECEELRHLFVGNPQAYMDRLRELITTKYKEDYEVMLVTESTIRADLNKAILKIQLINDPWEFFRNVTHAAMEYMQSWIEDRINDDRAEFLAMQRGMAKDSYIDSMIGNYRATGVIQ